MKQDSILVGAWWIVAALVLGALVPRLWNDDRDSFRTTWEVAAAGGETIRLSSAVTVWDGVRGTIEPQPAAVLVLARLAGPDSAGAAYFLFVTALALVWAGGARRLALALAAARPMSAVAGIASGTAALVGADGCLALLGAAPLPWVALALIEGRSGLGAVAVTLLALLSPAALGLLLPVLVLRALSRGAMPDEGEGSGWALAGLALALSLLVPEAPWAHAFRYVAPYNPWTGPYPLPQRSLAGALGLPFVAESSGTAATAAALVLWVAAAAGALRAGATGGRLLAAAFCAVAIGLGGVSFRAGGLPLAGPARFLALLTPGFAFHDFTAIAALAAGPLVLALAARVPVLAVGGIATLAVALSPGPPRADLPAAPALAPARGGGRLLALPLSIGNDRRWRRARPDDVELMNGTQDLLERNAPLVAEETATADPDALRRLLARLGVERAIVRAERAAEVGQVIASADGESLVRIEGGSARRVPRCLAATEWRFSSSIGNPAVSVPAPAVDRNRRTRWGTGGPQRPGQFFEIDLGSRRSLDRLDLDYAAFATDFPRGFRVVLSDDGRTWREVARRDPYRGQVAWQGDFPYYDGGRSGRVRVALGGVEARRLRIELTRETRLYDWSIAEICLRGR